MALRQLLLPRSLHTYNVLRASMAGAVESQGEHAGGYQKWKKLFFFVCCPCIAIVYLNVALEDHASRPEFKEYPYMRIRNKKFPWRDGVKTLFHHPYFNALPDGYEENVPPPESSFIHSLVKGSKH